ncbi:hypothetical protein GT354_45410 [Streptomyces sp. SID3343]|nr:hypothetical protein [Streptomyces sp. SID3343]
MEAVLSSAATAVRDTKDRTRGGLEVQAAPWGLRLTGGSRFPTCSTSTG